MKPLLLAAALLPFASLAAQPPIAIVIHGGAGTIQKEQMSAAQEQAYHATLKHAVEQGYAVLEQGGSSLAADHLGDQVQDIKDFMAHVAE